MQMQGVVDSISGMKSPNPEAASLAGFTPRDAPFSAAKVS